MAKTGRKHKDWRPAFLGELRKSGNITHSSKVAGVTRGTATYERKHNADFRRDMRDALDEVADTMEQEAWRRAVEGVEKPVTVAGESVIVKQYSDTLLIFLLKAVRPEKYRERFEHHHTTEEHRVAGGTREERRKEVMGNLMKLAQPSDN